MRRRLPSLNALRAFEAAGRYQSFTRAAEELHVTTAAVGHQVKALEDHLGVKLFRRLNRALVLTEAGHGLLPGLQDVFYRLTGVMQAFYQRDAERPVTVSVPPAFAGKWLLPRLDRFREQHPDIEVRIDATNRLVDLLHEDAEIGLRYGAGDYPGLRTDRLLAEEAFPVCSPELLEGDHPLRVPGDLRWHTLLHGEDRASADSWPDWTMWLQAAGVTGVDTRRGLRFSDTELALQVAIQGQGVALGSPVLAGDDLAKGRLIRLFEVSYPVTYAYYLVSPEAIADEPRVVAFRQWVLSEARTAQP
jgi:LysR family glycine cleavage system transcriptional activator